MPPLLYQRTASLSDIAQTADDITLLLKDAHILLMQGDLGTGKTTLSKEILKRYGVTSAVTSPTFNLVNEYSNASGQMFYHFDLYRIRHPEELSEIGFFDYLDSGHLCLIEWPEIIESYIQDKALYLRITHQDQNRLYEVWEIN